MQTEMGARLGNPAWIPFLRVPASACIALPYSGNLADYVAKYKMGHEAEYRFNRVWEQWTKFAKIYKDMAIAEKHRIFHSISRPSGMALANDSSSSSSSSCSTSD